MYERDVKQRALRVIDDRVGKARAVLSTVYGYEDSTYLSTALVDFLIDSLHLAEADKVTHDLVELAELAVHLYAAEHPRSRRVEGQGDDQASD